MPEAAATKPTASSLSDEHLAWLLDNGSKDDLRRLNLDELQRMSRLYNQRQAKKEGKFDRPGTAEASKGRKARLDQVEATRNKYPLQFGAVGRVEPADPTKSQTRTAESIPPVQFSSDIDVAPPAEFSKAFGKLVFQAVPHAAAAGADLAVGALFGSTPKTKPSKDVGPGVKPQDAGDVPRGTSTPGGFRVVSVAEGAADLGRRLEGASLAALNLLKMGEKQNIPEGVRKAAGMLANAAMSATGDPVAIARTVDLGRSLYANRAEPAVEMGRQFVDGLRESYRETLEDPNAQGSAEFGMNVADMAGLGLAARGTATAARVARGASLLSPAQIAQKAADVSGMVRGAPTKAGAVGEAVAGVPEPISAAVRPDIVAGAAERLGAEELPTAFKGERTAVRAEHVGLHDEMAERFNISKNRVRKLMRENASPEDPSGFDWLRDQVARARAVEEGRKRPKGVSRRQVGDPLYGAKREVREQDRIAAAVESAARAEPQNPVAPVRAAVEAADTPEGLQAVGRTLERQADDAARIAEDAKRITSDEGRDLEARAVAARLAAEEGLRLQKAKLAEKIEREAAAALAPERPPTGAAPERPAVSGFSREAGRVRTDVATTIALSAVGGAIGNALLAREDGQLFSPGGLLGGAAMGALFSRFLFHAPLRAELLKFYKSPDFPTSMDKLPSFERVFDEALWKTLPAEDLSPGQVAGAITSSAPTMGALGLGGLTWFANEDADPIERGLTTGLAMLVGAAGGKVAARGFPVGKDALNIQRAMRRLAVSERNRLSPEAWAAKERIFIGRNSIMNQIARTVSELPEGGTANGKIVQDFLTGEADEAAVPAKYRLAAKRARTLFDELGAELIKVGLAEGKVAETITDNMGTYVPRLYALYEDQDKALKVINWMQQNGISLAKTGKLDMLKKRADLPDDVRAALGEIVDDPGFLLGKRGIMTASDIAARKWQNWVASSEYTLADDVAQAAQSGAGLDASKFIGAGGRTHLRVGGKRFRQMPDDKRFGPLAGKFVDEDMAFDMEEMHLVARSMGRAILDHGTALFKASKVTYNPGSLLRNIYGQIPINDWAGLGPIRGLPTYKEALKDYWRKGPLYREAEARGLFGNEWYGREVAELWSTRPGDIDLLGKLPDRVATIGAKAADKMQAFHTGTEQYMKLSLYTHARKRLGMSADDAVRFAMRFAFNYDDVPRWVKITRRSIFGAPFISFSYKALPRAMESALAIGNIRKMMRFWKYPLAAGAVNEYSVRRLGEEKNGDKGWTEAAADMAANPIRTIRGIALNALSVGTGGMSAKALERAGFEETGQVRYSEFLPNYTGDIQILKPYRDHFERFRFWDGTWTAAWGDLGEFNKGTIGEMMAKMDIPFMRQWEPSNPWLLLGITMATNRDLFTGKEIVTPGAHAGQALKEMLEHTARMFGPPLAPPAGYGFTKITKSLKGEFSERPDIPTPLNALISEVGGSRDRPVDPREAAKFQMKELREESQTLRRVVRSMEFKGISRESKQYKRAVERAKAKAAEIKRFSDVVKNLPKTPEKLKQAIEKSKER